MSLFLKTSPLSALSLVALLGCSAQAANITVEAEANPAAGDMKILDDPTASGGKAVSMPRDWQPLLKAAVPAGESFTVWVRYKGGSILAKKTPGGKQSDLKWSYDKPAELTWKKLGRYTREELGDTLLIIRGGGGGQGPVLDAVVFASDENFDPNTQTAAAGTAVTQVAPLPANVGIPSAGDAPKGILIEAEANPTAGDMKILDDPEASGGKAVSIARDYQPLFKAAVPAGEKFTLWVRYKAGAILVKKTPGGKQSDLKWSYDKPSTLTWKKIGTYTREELGDTLLIIRGAGAGQGPVVDAVVFGTEENFTPVAATRARPAAAGTTTEAKLDTGNSNINEGAALALGMIKAPTGTFVEAEANKPGGTNEIVEVSGASGGKAVTSDRDYQNVFQAPIPAEGDAFKVYVRHKGGPFALKINNNGKGSDRWFFRSPSDWTWTETDTFSRDELGKEFRIGRGAGDKTVFIDAVVFAPDVKRALPADRPDPAKAPQKIAASIDWSRSTATVSPMLWGINEHEITNPKAATDPKFQQLLGSTKPTLIRIHHAGLMDSWTDEKTRDWDVEKIKAGFAASTGYGNAPIMINLTWAPKWMGGKKVLSEAEEDQLAALWGRLVKIMRDDVKRPVAYWEITNELEGTYEKAGQLDALWRLYNKSAAAMRKEDPKAKLGGAAFTYAKPSWIAGFLQNCDDVQFLSWHNYGTGDLYQSNEKLFSAVDSNVGALAKGALELAQKHAKGRKLETFLTETNVKYTWDPYERRHQNQVGSIFHALVVKKMAELDVTGVNLWQQRGDAYGSLINNKNEIFPSYTLYSWGPKYLTGKMAAASSGDEKLLEIMPVTHANGQKAILLLNKADHTLLLPAAKTLLPGFKSAQQINADGTQSDLKIADGELSLPGYSLTLLATQ